MCWRVSACFVQSLAGNNVVTLHVACHGGKYHCHHHAIGQRKAEEPYWAFLATSTPKALNAKPPPSEKCASSPRDFEPIGTFRRSGFRGLQACSLEFGLRFPDPEPDKQPRSPKFRHLPRPRALDVEGACLDFNFLGPKIREPPCARGSYPRPPPTTT